MLIATGYFFGMSTLMRLVIKSLDIFHRSLPDISSVCRIELYSRCLGGEGYTDCVLSLSYILTAKHTFRLVLYTKRDKDSGGNAGS